MFSFERLVIALAKERSTLPFLSTLLGILEVMVDEEVKGRRALAAFGIQVFIAYILLYRMTYCSQMW